MVARWLAIPSTSMNQPLNSQLIIAAQCMAAMELSWIITAAEYSSIFTAVESVFMGSPGGLQLFTIL